MIEHGICLALTPLQYTQHFLHKHLIHSSQQPHDTRKQTLHPYFIADQKANELPKLQANQAFLYSSGFAVRPSFVWCL